MRILLTSDLHYKLRQYDWLIKVAPSFDAIVIAGDHIDIASSVPPDVQIAALSASFTAISRKTHLLVCSGNHDLNARNSAGEKTADWLQRLRGETLAADGDNLTVGDTLFTICPWWDGDFAAAGVEQLLEQAAAQRSHGARWVWLYHAPPEGPLSWNGRRHYGDSLLADLVRRHAPTAVLCGHIHEAPFKTGGSWVDRIGNTLLFNAGQQIGETPACVEIDFAKGFARWNSLAGDETQALNLEPAQ